MQDAFQPASGKPFENFQCVGVGAAYVHGYGQVPLTGPLQLAGKHHFLHFARLGGVVQVHPDLADADHTRVVQPAFQNSQLTFVVLGNVRGMQSY